MKYVQRTFRLHAGTVEMLDEYSSRTGVTRTFAVEKAITEYLEREGCTVGTRSETPSERSDGA